MSNTKQIEKMNVNIFREDYFSVYSLIYFITLTTIMLIIFFSGFNFLLKETTNEKIYIIYGTLLVVIYIIFLGLYYLSWSLESIFVIILIFAFLLSILSFVILYFAPELCKKSEEKQEERNYMKYIFFILLFITIYLAFYQSCGWNIYDTIRFIIMLILIRIMYYIVKKYDMSYNKTIIDVTLTIVLFFKLRHMYELLNQKPVQQFE